MTRNDILSREKPTMLLVDGHDKSYAFMHKELEDRGWTIHFSGSVFDTIRIAAELPISLVMLVLGDAVDIPLESARAVRSLAVPSAAAPILAFRSSNIDTSTVPTQIDAVIDRSKSFDALIRELDSWRPVSLEPTRRIAAMFGQGPIDGMIERLARRLEPALANIERGLIDRSEAHRLAGLCGTLGFGQAHAAWLDLSLGDESVVSDVRRTTRLVLAAVARGL